MSSWFNLPNFLTLLRLLLVPFIIQAILDRRPFLTFCLFAIAAATDWLDGFAARRLGSTTSQGAYLDPIADKCLLSGVFLALAASGLVPWWFVAVVFGRDLYILAAVAVLMAVTPLRKFTPSPWGKASTFVQIATAAAWIARGAIDSGALDAVSSGILWPCAALTIWSGLDYTWRGFRALRGPLKIPRS